MPRFRARRVLTMPVLFVAALPLAACLGLGTAPPVTSLDGAYRGEVTKSGNSRLHCPVRRQLTINVSAGELRGEIFSDEAGARQSQRFAAFIESGGAVFVPVRIGDSVYSLEGRLDGRAFRGEVRSDHCTMSAFARRSDGA